MPTILGANSVSDTGYNVAQSTMIDTNAYYYRTASGGSQRTFTLSFWVKRSMFNTGHHHYVFSAYQDADNRISIAFLSTDTFVVFAQNSSGTQLYLQTNKQFRDPSAWMNIVVAVDTTQGTASNRVKLYVNGTQETSFQNETYPDQNEDLISNTTIYIGAYTTSANFFHGYLAEYVYIDGSALAPTSFGEFDDDSPNIWKPIDVSGLTFGTTGFYLDFATRATDPIDASGNGNNFSSTNVLAVDHRTDTCTNNYAVINPLHYQSRNSSITEGNLKILSDTSDAWDTHYGISSIAVSSGKWYVEAKVTTTTTSQNILGIISTSQFINSSLKDNGVAAVEKSGRITGGGNNIQTGLTAFSNGDIAAVAFDADNGTAQFYRNGSTYGNQVTSIASDEYYFATTTYDTGGVVELNFGGGMSFSISTGNSDDNNYGNFEYDVPDGYYALNTKNLAEFG